MRKRECELLSNEDYEPTNTHSSQGEFQLYIFEDNEDVCKHFLSFGWHMQGANKAKSKLACILEADESTRMRMGNSIPHHHEDHIAGKGENSLQHYNFVHKFIPMPRAMKIPAAKAAVDKEWEKNGENFGVEPDESQK